MQYQAAIFDFDGTMFDTEKNEMEALTKLVTQVFGHAPDPDKLKVTFGMTAINGLRYLGCTEEQIAWISPRWHEASHQALQTTPLFDGLEDTFAQLKQLGVQMGIVTSRGMEGVQTGLRARGIVDYFSHIICPKDTTHHKPHPEPLLECLHRMQLLPEQALYIGDSAFDMQCAQAAGTASGLALWGTHQPDLQCTYRLETPLDIVQACKNKIE